MTELLRFLRYGWVALMSAGGDWLVFSGLISLIGIGHLQSLMMARVVGGVVSFLANRYWTWGAHRRVAVTQQGRRFLVLYGFSYGLAVALFSLLVDGLGFSAYPGKLATDLTCFLVNYAIMNTYVFNPREGLSKVMRLIAPRGR
jgi:putative flippase GtrA